MFRLYARVSTNDKGQDAGAQLHQLREANGPDVTEYVEQTSAVGKRPIWQRLLREARPGDTIMCWKVDRCFRSFKDAAVTLDALNQREIAFRSLTENFDTGTPMGRAMFGMLAVFAEIERSMLSERTKAGMARAKAQGKHVGRPWKRRPGAASR